MRQVVKKINLKVIVDRRSGNKLIKVVKPTILFAVIAGRMLFVKTLNESILWSCGDWYLVKSFEPKFLQREWFLQSCHY